LFGCGIASVHAQTYLQPNEYQQRLNNGLNLFYTQLENTNQFEVMLAYRFGSMAEDTTTDGLAHVCHTVFLRGLQQKLQQVEPAIRLDGRFGHEVCTYHFKVSLGKFEKAMDAIANYYAQEPDSAMFANAIVQNATLTGVVENTVMYPAEQALIHRQWGNRAPAISIYGQLPQVDSSTIAKASEMYQSAYCMEFALMVFSGPEQFRKVWSKVQDLLGYISSCRGELYNTKLANLFPKPRLNSQLVYNVANATPSRYQRMYHGPYVSFDPEGAVATQVLKNLFAQSPALAIMADSLGIKTLRLANDPLKFASSLTWHIFPAKDSLHAALSNFDTLMIGLASGNKFPEVEIEAAKATMIKQFEGLRNHPSQKMYLIANYWSQSVLHWLNDYPKMVQAVNSTKLSDVVNRYMHNQTHTTLLLLNENDSAVYDIQKFASTYSQIANITLQYQKNTANFVSTTGDSILNALKQTLLINPNTIVSFHSVAYKSEILDIKDDSLKTLLNKHDGFYIYPKSLFGKKTFRLDIYRTAKLIGTLLNMGVMPKQLTGTGALKKEVEANERYETTVTPAY
jgi:predicted Zn-dependent peptidase